MALSTDDIVNALALGNPRSARSMLDQRLAELGGSLFELCNDVALRTAERFLAGSISYSDADTAANALWARITDELAAYSEQALPEPAFSIFGAFDEGEYSHDGDDSGVDPVQKYTVPQLQVLLGMD